MGCAMKVLSSVSLSSVSILPIVAGSGVEFDTGRVDRTAEQRTPAVVGSAGGSYGGAPWPVPTHVWSATVHGSTTK